MHSYVVKEQVIDQHGTVAAVLSSVHMEATVLGEDCSGLFIITDVWVLGDDGWRGVAATLLTAHGRRDAHLSLSRCRGSLHAAGRSD